MKKNYLLTLLAIFVLPLVVLAHAPKKVTAEYNAETGMLKIDVPHKVKDVSKHYISEIVITINGEETKVSYTEQSSLESHDVEISLPDLEKGTIVNISAKCNKLGSKKGEIVIE